MQLFHLRRGGREVNLFHPTGGIGVPLFHLGGVESTLVCFEVCATTQIFEGTTQVLPSVYRTVGPIITWAKETGWSCAEHQFRCTSSHPLSSYTGAGFVFVPLHATMKLKRVT